MVSVPRSVGQLPVYYNRKMPYSHDYVEVSQKPLYPFGYGLSYTTFEYANLRFFADAQNDRGVAQNGKSVTLSEANGSFAAVSVDVTNSGSLAGDEVVQVYVRDLVASTVRPRKQLCAFRRVSIGPGETVTVSLPLPRSAFELVNASYERVVESGEFELQVGASSEDIRQTLNVTISQ